MRQRRPQAHIAHRFALATRGRLLQRPVQLRKVLDHANDELLGILMRDVLDDVRDVDHGLVIYHAESKIIEECELHSRSPSQAQLLRDLDARLWTVPRSAVDAALALRASGLA